MNGRIQSLNGDNYAHFFANKYYFILIYPMYIKGKARNTLFFKKEVVVPEKHTFDG